MTSILVTGGTGSFGTAFVRELLRRDEYDRIVVYSRGEHRQAAMRAAMDDDPRLRFFIGDVRDADRLRLAMRGVDTVVHAAALKRVPALEYNPTEAVETNVRGAVNVIGAAIETDVRRVVALSTDKAAGPVNLYGATKMTMEKLMVAGNALAGADGPRFACTRYGNVMGSAGSVLPLFLARARDGLSLPVTDARMTRFWMTLAEAVAFVRTALDRMRGGEVFVPRLPAFRVLDLARAATVAAGRGVLDTRTVGIRPGEKLHESLVTEDEAHLCRRTADGFTLVPPETADLPVPAVDGAPVPDGFRYRSDTAERMTVERLVDGIRAVEGETETVGAA